MLINLKALQQQLFEKYYMLFIDEEENRIYYMDIFKEYTNTIEEFVLTKLRENTDDEQIEKFLDELKYNHFFKLL